MIYPFTSSAYQNFGAEVIINHNSWTGRARKPVKTSLNVGESKELNALEKYIFAFEIFEKY